VFSNIRGGIGLADIASFIVKTGGLPDRGPI
jgi:hypothetical protein